MKMKTSLRDLAKIKSIFIKTEATQINDKKVMETESEKEQFTEKSMDGSFLKRKRET